MNIAITTYNSPDGFYVAKQIINNVNSCKTLILQEGIGKATKQKKETLINYTNPKKIIEKVFHTMLIPFAKNSSLKYDAFDTPPFIRTKYFFRSLKKGVIIHSTSDINSTETEAFIKDKKIDLMVVVGGRIIKKNIIDAIEIINLHTGVLPDYRGCDSEFWALYNKEFDKIGFTIHYVNEEIDAGDIINVTTINFNGDGLLRLHKRNIIEGTKKMIDVLHDFEKGKEIKSFPPDKGTYYKKPTVEERKELEMRFKNGLL